MGVLFSPIRVLSKRISEGEYGTKRIEVRAGPRETI
tara:strand:+ start:484 stop:591 length:108 start_codon:yes stop_codon:yes gene_type:complete